MRTILLAIIFTITANVSFGQSKKVQTATIKTEISCDHCNKCESCGQNIYNKLTENKGVKSVKVDSETNSIIVKYKPSQISLAALEKAISASGYKANETMADSEAYQKLDGCCKKKADTN